MLGNKAGRNSKANESGRDESLKECSTPSDSTIPAESLTRNLKEDRDRDFEKKSLVDTGAARIYGHCLSVQKPYSSRHWSPVPQGSG